MRQFIDALNETDLPEAAGDGLNYNLKSRYDEFNAKFFNGELPACKLRFGVLKGKGGHCTCKMRPPAVPHNPRVLKLRGLHKHTGYTLVPDSLAITISSAYVRDPAEIDAILLHEMIHAWFFHKEDWSVHHGVPFLRMRAELSQKSGINIPLTDDTRGLEVSQDVKVKRVAVFIYRLRGKTSFGLISAKAMDTVKTRALEKVAWIDRTRRDPDLHVSMRIVSGPFWTKMALSLPVARERIKSLYVLKPEVMEQALAEFETGEEIFDYYGRDAVVAAAKADPRNAGNYD